MIATHCCEKITAELRQAQQKAQLLLMLLNRETLKSIVHKIENKPLYIKIRNSKVALSYRQTQCLLYLLRGESATYIAMEMKLSPRTVQSYIDALKNQTVCRFKI